MQLKIQPPSIAQDVQRTLHTLQRGGIAIIPTSIGYAIIGSTPTALDRIFTAKQRPAGKKHAMLGSYALHCDIHTLLPVAHETLIQHLAVVQDLPLGVVAPFNASHPLLISFASSFPSASSDGPLAAAAAAAATTPFTQTEQQLDTDAGINETAYTKDHTLAMLINGGPFQEELVRVATAAGTAVFGSSANLSGRGSKVRVEDIEEEVKAVADLVVDYGMRMFGGGGGGGGGSGGGRASSTMIDFRDDIRVIRFGACYEVIRDVVGRLIVVSSDEEEEEGGMISNSRRIVLPEDPGVEVLPSGHYQG